MTIPPHGHGTWEALIVYSGRLSHTVSERTDDGVAERHADLKVVDDWVLEHGDMVVMPPAEIHRFTALSSDTYVITIVGGKYKVNHHFFFRQSKRPT